MPFLLAFITVLILRGEESGWLDEMRFIQCGRQEPEGDDVKIIITRLCAVYYPPCVDLLASILFTKGWAPVLHEQDKLSVGVNRLSVYQAAIQTKKDVGAI